MKPKYRQTVKQLTDYYVACGYNHFRLTLYSGAMVIYNGFLECYMDDMSSYDVKEFFCNRDRQEIKIYIEE